MTSHPHLLATQLFNVSTYVEGIGLLLLLNTCTELRLIVYAFVCSNFKYDYCHISMSYSALQHVSNALLECFKCTYINNNSVIRRC